MSIVNRVLITLICPYSTIFLPYISEELVPDIDLFKMVQSIRPFCLAPHLFWGLL